MVLDMLAAMIPIIVLVLVLLIFVLKGLALIGDDEVGILYKRMLGKTMPQGQVIARNGEVGVQANTLMPGLYWRVPFIWKIEKVPTIVIKPNQIGVVVAIDGNPLTNGHLLADEVSCNNFQDAKAFLDNGGMKGPQIGILKPGVYRINTYAFKIEAKPVTDIPAEKIGVVIAKDGTPLPGGFIIAPDPKITPTTDYPNARDCHKFQDGQAFLNSAGYRGTQLETLQPGTYYINPLLFEVEIFEQGEVPPGYVAILRSNVGKELDKGAGTPNAPIVVEATSYDKQPMDITLPVHESCEQLLITDKNMRGIWNEPIAPGKYNLNPLAFTAYLVPTSAVTIDWADDFRSNGKDAKMVAVVKAPLSEQINMDSDTKATEFFKFSQLKVTSKDGFQLEVDVRMIIRIRPENAAYVIARFGSVKNLIEQIVHPLIDSSFRNKAGSEKAISFIQGRTELQQDALKAAQREFANYHIEAQNLLIAYIKADQALLDTQTKKEIALQQQTQFTEEAKAQEMRIDVMNKQANAEKQPQVVEAMLSIDIEKNKAEARRREAEGERDAAKTMADGKAYEVKALADAEAYRSEEVGRGIAAGYRTQADVLGPEMTAAIKLINEIGVNNVKVTPDILINGQGNDGNNAPFNIWMLQQILDKMKNPVQPSK